MRVTETLVVHLVGDEIVLFDDCTTEEISFNVEHIDRVKQALDYFRSNHGLG